MSLPSSKWEADLSISSNHNFWPQICLNTFRMTRNPNLQLIQYKILHRTHYTGQRMFRMGLTHSNICSHCTDNTPDDYAHALWFCAPVQKFWLEVCEDYLCINKFRNVLSDYISMETMSASLKHQLAEFHSLWSPLISFIT